MSAPSGAERLPDADLPGALVHRHEHDVHDDDAADDDPDADHGRDYGEQHLGQATPERDQRVGLVDREIVGLVGTQPVSDSHRLLGPLHGGGDEFGAGHLHRDGRGLPAPVDRFEGRDRHQNESVERLPQHPPLLGGHRLYRHFAAGESNPPPDGLVCVRRRASRPHRSPVRRHSAVPGHRGRRAAPPPRSDSPAPPGRGE